MKRIFTLLTIFWLMLTSLTLTSQVLVPVTWKFEKKQISETKYELTFKAKIKTGWHLYSQELPDVCVSVPTSFEFKSNDKIKFIGKVKELSRIHKELDKDGNVTSRFFSKKAIFKQIVEITSNNDTVKGSVNYMSCNDEQCTPPTDKSFEFTFTKTKKDIQKENKKSHEGLLGFFLIAFLGGIIAILTPCVFPMIPMTVSFFMHSGDNKARAKYQASIFGISIVFIYTLIGTVVAVTLGANFANWLSTHWLPNILFFVIFWIFAASFFGMFEITLPAWMTTKTDKQADKGGIGGPFFMALTLVLVSFSCTAPIVGTILVESANGQILRPIIGMLGFALAFAIPFTLFAFFPRLLNNLPKSGGWLNSIKVVLGFIELALGLKFLSVADQTYHWHLLDREIYIAIWIVLFFLMGLYLLGKIKFAHDSEVKHISVPRLFLVIATFTFVVYLIPGMWGAPLKALSGYLPPMETHDFDMNKIVRNNIKAFSPTPQVINSTQAPLPKGNENYTCEKPMYADFLSLPHGLDGYFDYKQALNCAKAQNKPLFVDFTGHGCVNCREMEANVWADPRVLKILRTKYIVVALYVDDKKELPKEEWYTSSFDNEIKNTIGKKNADFQISKFQINAQPYYVLMNLNGDAIVKPRGYNLNVEEFIAYLEKGVAEFYKK